MPGRPTPHSRKPYAAPEISVHGDVKQVTAAGGNKSLSKDNALRGKAKTA